MVLVWRIMDDLPNSPNFPPRQTFPLYGNIKKAVQDIADEIKFTNSITMDSARSIEEIKNLCKFAKKRGVETYGCVREPLFTSIAVDRVVPNILHLFLCITDVMINLLILELQRLDSIHKKDASSQWNSTVYENF